MKKNLLSVAVSLCFALVPLGLQAQDDAALRAEVLAALHNDALMSEAEQAREAERQPADVLSFFRLREDMKVMELLPFGGWYTKILGQVLARARWDADPTGYAAVLLNAGAAIYVAGLAGSYAEGIGRAREVIGSGAARAALDRLRRASLNTSG